MTSKLLHLFTRTPLHVGAGASAGAIDQPILRERHTGFPIIPATSLKGSFADQWPATHDDGKGGKQRLATEERDINGKKTQVLKQADEAAWLFGSDTTDLSFAGALLFSEARVLAFPIRSARGSYAWITCPLMLQRAKRDGVISGAISITEPKDDEAIFSESGPLSLNVKVKGVDRTQVVLEEYTFTNTGAYPEALAKELAGLIEDELFKSITERLVILSNGMMSHFATTACEIAQHVRISDETGTADEGGLFNQENVPSETLFYSILSATRSRVPSGEFGIKSEEEACAAFQTKIGEIKVFQFGGDASTGLGFCTVTLNEKKGA
jgi:CRISPR-associated protein Cmr4